MVVDPARSCEEVSIMGEGEGRSKSTRLSFREEGEKKINSSNFFKEKQSDFAVIQQEMEPASKENKDRSM